MLRRASRAACLFAAMVGLATAGGLVSLVPDNNGGGTTNPPTTITIKVSNQTSRYVDSQVYVGKPGETKDVFFTIPADQQKGAFQFLHAGEEAVATVSCDQVDFLGTLGGLYGDDLRNPLKAGQKKILEMGDSVQCGDTIVFTFTYDVLRDSLITSLAIVPLGG